MFNTSGSLINFDRFHDTEEIQNKALRNAAEGGPNSGFEIDEVEFFKDPKLTDEFPELKDSIDLIVSTEAFIARLVDFRHRVLARKGMDRGMAQELFELIPSLESHTSTRHFTEELSGIGVEMSLESIDYKLWGVIGVAIAFVATLIYKFIRWLGYGSGGTTGDATNLEDVKKAVKETDKKVDDQKKIVDETVRIVRDGGQDFIEVEVPDHQDLDEIKRSTLPIPLKTAVIKSSKALGSGLGEDLMKRKHYVKVKVSDVLRDIEGGAHIYDYIREPNKWAKIIYNWHNPALNLILTSFEGFRTGASLVLAHIGLMEEIIADLETLETITRDQKLSGQDIGPNSRVASKLKTMDLALLDKTDFKVGSKRYQTPGHWALAVKEASNSEQAFRTAFDDLEDLLDSHANAMFRLSSVKFDNIVAFIDALQKAEPTLRRFEKIAKNEEARERYAFNDYDRIRGERAQLLMKVATQSARNFNALMMVYGIISKVYEEASKHGTLIVSKLKDNARKIVAFYNRYDEHPPPSLLQLVEKLEAQQAAHREAEIAARMIPKDAWISLRDLPVRVSFGSSDDYDETEKSVTMTHEEAEAGLRYIMDTNKKK